MANNKVGTMTIRSLSLIAALPGLMFGVSAAAAQTGNAVTGAKLFLQCRACHTVAAGQPSGVGPNLSGIVGAKAGTKPGYTFSSALKASNITWSAATLDGWLKKPSALVPGNKMVFAGVAAPQARADIIAYLSTLKR